MPLDREPAEREPEAPAAEALHHGFTALGVLAEELRQQVGGDRPAAVADAHEEAAVGRALGVHVDGAAVGGDADRVVEEVQQHPLDQRRVAAHDRMALAGPVERDRLRLRHEPGLGEHRLAERCPRDVLHAKRHRAAVETTHVEEGTHQVTDALRRAAHQRDVARRADGIQTHHVERRFDDADRVLDVVHREVDEVVPPPLALA